MRNAASKERTCNGMTGMTRRYSWGFGGRMWQALTTTGPQSIWLKSIKIRMKYVEALDLLPLAFDAPMPRLGRPLGIEGS